MESNFQRARHPDQMEVRRAHLLSTARSLLVGGMGLRALSLNELARQASMAKANVYRYFETREALLLELLWIEWQRWFEHLRTDWPEDSCGMELDAVVSRLARSLARETLLCELTSALPTVLEQNLSEPSIRAFKRASLAFFRSVAQFLADRAPGLSEAAYAELLNDAAHMIIGLYPALHPAPAVVRALEDPELHFFRREFRTEFERVLGALARDHASREGGAAGGASALTESLDRSLKKS
jgi:AcrR family transcriptional regulator